MPSGMKLDLEANVSETTRLLKGGAGALGSAVKDLPDPLKLGLNDKTVTTYEAEDLTRWSAMCIYSGSIFMQRPVMRILFLQLGTCWAIAYILYSVTSHPENYRTSAVQEIIKTITVSIAFLLGLFLNQCVTRWWDTVVSLRAVTGTIRKLVMSTINLELPRTARENIARIAVLSVKMLHHEIIYNKHECRAQTGTILAGEPSVNLNTYWDELFQGLLERGDVTEEEVAVLAEAPWQQRSFFCWSLVSERIAAQREGMTTPDGDVDMMAYDRLCGLVQSGIDGVSYMKTLAAYQLPFIYVHMLAFMVHFVNILTAIGSGVSVGLMLAQSAKTGHPLDRGELMSDMVFLVVQAFLYQAFLSIGAGLSFPVTGGAYNIPLDELIVTLEKQVRLMNSLANGYVSDKK